MPGGDGTGPLGQGTMTGWGRDYCAGFGNAGFSRGLGRGFGRRGFARRTGFIPYPQQCQPVYQELTKEQQMESLNKNIAALEQEKQQIDAEIGEIKKRMEQLQQ